MKVKRYIVDLVDDGSLAFKLSEEELLMNWNADEVEASEDCISREELLKRSHIVVVEDMWHMHQEIEVVNVEDIKRIPSVQPKTGWIPCSERMPEVGSEVLVCFDFKGNRSVYISNFYGDGEFHGLDDEYLTSEGRKCRKAVAWMPLPQPYKESEDEE